MVNVRDVDKSNLPEGDMLINIFARQKELMGKYEHIEAANGLLQTPMVPVDLHCKFGQARLKDFAWRTTEELGEALEASIIHPDDPDHVMEEVADALHFLVEFTILAGMTPEEVVGKENVDGKDLLYKLYDQGHQDWDAPLNFELLFTFLVGRVTKQLAVTCNFLKNKPWKQSHMLTDEDSFKEALRLTWIAFFGLCTYLKLYAWDLYAIYYGKSDVNKFRQRSNY